MANPYVFIGGCARSGTTLLRQILNTHPQIVITRESHWIPRVFASRKGITPEGFVTPKLIPHLLKHPKFAQLGLSEEELVELLENNALVSYADFTSRIFDLYGQRCGKTLVGDKTPGYVRLIDMLHTLWPRARFVQLIRDGREVCLSVADWRKAPQKKPGVFSTWKDDPVSTTAFWWELNVRLGRDAGKRLGPELYYEIRYESLVTNPGEECAALCAFLQVPYDEVMLRFHEGRIKHEWRKKAGFSLSVEEPLRPITPGLRDWRSQMPGENVERFEAAAGSLLDELGYARGVPRPRSGALEHASEIRRRLAEDEKWVGILARASGGTPDPASRDSGLLAKSQFAVGSQKGRTQT